MPLGSQKGNCPSEVNVIVWVYYRDSMLVYLQLGQRITGEALKEIYRKVVADESGISSNIFHYTENQRKTGPQTMVSLHDTTFISVLRLSFSIALLQSQAYFTSHTQTQHSFLHSLPERKPRVLYHGPVLLHCSKDFVSSDLNLQTVRSMLLEHPEFGNVGHVGPPAV